MITKRIKKSVAKKLLIIIIIVNIFLRIPGLFDPVSYGDECIYLTLGQAFNKGLVFYRDIHDNKPPLLYLIAAISGGSQFWLRLIMIAWNSINVYLMYKLALLMLKSQKAGLVAASFFTWFSLLPEGRVANGEIFMIMPAVLGVYLIYRLAEKKKTRLFKWNLNSNTIYFLAGLLFSLGFLFKIPIAFDFMGILIALFIFKKEKLSPSLLKEKIKRLFLIIMGFCLPILVSILYYWSKGAFTPYVRSALMQNIGYLSSWSEASENQSFLVRNQGLLLRGVIVVIVTLCLYLLRKKLEFNFTHISLWYIFALFGVLLSERPYPHYLIELAPPLALLFTFLIFKISLARIFTTIILLTLLIYYFIKFNFWWYKNIEYYQTFLKYASNVISKQEFYSYFGSKNLNDYSVAEYIKTHSNPKERIFVWGEGSCIYALSKRLPPGRYTVNYHIYDFNGFQETLEAIKNKKPRIIVLIDKIEEKYLELENYINKHYIITSTIDKTLIYKLKNKE